jgi:hypothetical protein
LLPSGHPPHEICLGKLPCHNQRNLRNSGNVSGTKNLAREMWRERIPVANSSCRKTYVAEHYLYLHIFAYVPRIVMLWKFQLRTSTRDLVHEKWWREHIKVHEYSSSPKNHRTAGTDHELDTLATATTKLTWRRKGASCVEVRIVTSDTSSLSVKVVRIKCSVSSAGVGIAT